MFDLNIWFIFWVTNKFGFKWLVLQTSVASEIVHLHCELCGKTGRRWWHGCMHVTVWIGMADADHPTRSDVNEMKASELSLSLCRLVPSLPSLSRTCTGERGTQILCISGPLSHCISIPKHAPFIYKDRKYFWIRIRPLLRSVEEHTALESIMQLWIILSLIKKGLSI